MKFIGGILTICLVAILIFSSCSDKKEKKEIKKTATELVLDKNVIKIKESLKSLKAVDSFPRNVKKGKTNWDLVGVQDWCSGFWPGVVWYAYEHSKDSTLLKGAEDFTAPLQQIAYQTADNHDIGFMVYCSYGNGYRLTKNEAYKTVILAAADSLATLFNPKVGTICSWPGNEEFGYNTIIDNMMNLELLFWASKNGGNKELYTIAESHANVSMKNLVRPDYSIFHVTRYNEETGEFIEGKTHQGYADDSMWARGQGWGIYGFAISFRETGNKEFLETSEKLADHFLERLPEDSIPYWDFDDPKIPNVPKDASAAAVAACGMLELATLTESEELKAKYFNAGKTLVEKLASKDYLSGDQNQALLLHSTGHLPNNSEIDIPIIYADYYFMEALLRLKKAEVKK